MAVRVAVIGAGPAGLTAAHALAERGAEVDLFEAGPQVGGLARSIDLWGRRADLGSHTFASADPRVTALWDRLVGEGRTTLPLRRGILTGAGVLDYPPRPWPVLRSLGVRRGVPAAGAALRARLARSGRPTAPSSARGAVERRFGGPLTDLLLEPYCRKLWGRPSSEVDPAFAWFLLGTAAASRPTFVYPTAGTGSVWEKMTAELLAHGGGRARMHLKTPVLGLQRADAGTGPVTTVVTAAGATDVDHVVSSLPLPLLVRALPDPPQDVLDAARGLTSRGTVLVFLRLVGAGPLGWTWLYDYDPDHCTGRVTDVAAWGTSQPPDGTSVWSAECWGPVGGTLWELDDAAVTARVVAELAESGLIGSGVRLQDSHVVRLPGTHPECPTGTTARLATLQRHVDSVPGLSTLGRHGRHGIPGIGDCMEMALDTVDTLVGSSATVGVR